MITQEYREKLIEAAKDISRFYHRVSEASKEAKMNKGQGYSYNYIRSVIIYGTYENLDIIELAIEVVEKVKAEKEARVEGIKAKIEAL